MSSRVSVAVGAVLLHVCIGSVYTWSVFTKPLMSLMGITLPQAQWVFSLAILFLGLSAAFAGKIVERLGAQRSAIVSTAFFCSGLIVSYLATQLNSLYLLYTGYGILGGIGLGIGYITPISTLVKLFPHKRGLATGLAIMGFGFAAIVFGGLTQFYISRLGVGQAFMALAMTMIPIMCLSTWLLGRYTPEYEPQQNDCSVAEATRNWRFYVLWYMLFINITCGIGLISIASPMAQDVGFTAAQAAGIVAVMGIANGLGRFAWSSVSDYLGRPLTYTLFFVIQVVAFFAIHQFTNGSLFQIALYVIMSCYGGGFATIPAYLSDVFGMKHLSAIHGRILTAWSAAGIVGPLAVAYCKQATGGYATVMEAFGLCFLISTAVSIGLMVSVQRMAVGWDSSKLG